MNFFMQLGKNRVFITTALAWIIAQVLKVLIGFIREKKFNFKWLVGTGGMPSSHCAGATAFATSLGLEFGFDSPIAAIGMIFAIVTMFDAQGARRAIGKQAGVLNKMFEDIYFKKPIGLRFLASASVGSAPASRRILTFLIISLLLGISS